LLELLRHPERERWRPQGCPHPDAGHDGGIGWGKRVDLRGCHGWKAGDNAKGKEKARHAQEATAIVISGLDS
jgi:hypothetical protein